MYCSECGVEASGKFCWSCGAPLHRGRPAAAATPAAGGSGVAWDRDDPSYAAVMAVPAVRDLLAAEAAAADHPMSAEEFLAKCEKVLPQKVPLGPLAEILGPLYGQLGIKTGRTEKRTIPLAAGVALAGVLVSLARHGNEVRRVEQAEDGCVVHAEMRSTMWHGKGHLVVTVAREGAGASIEAATKIPGQLFDWVRARSACRLCSRTCPTRASKPPPRRLDARAGASVAPPSGQRSRPPALPRLLQLRP